jgi:hypothetical protein
MLFVGGKQTMDSNLEINLNVTFDSKNSLLTHYWTDELLKDEVNYVLCLSKLATLVDTYRPHYLLFVFENEQKNYEKEVHNWMEKCILPVLYNVGVKKMALCFEDNIQLPDIEFFSSKIKFEVQKFSSSEDALMWLISNN